MGSGFDKDRTIRNYGSLLRSLLPGLTSFICYSRNGSQFCAWPAEGPVSLTPEYNESLEKVIVDPANAAEFGQVEFSDATAFIVPFPAEADSKLGVITVLIEKSEETLTHFEIADLINPAINNLQSELNLSFRLMVAYKKLNVLSAEENLLHEIEKLVHLNRASDDTLKQIVRFCSDLLGLRGVALMVPDKQIRIFEGETPKPVELRLMLSEMLDTYNEDPEDFAFVMAGETAVGKHSKLISGGSEADKELLAVPILQDSTGPIGMLVLSGWKNTAFSMLRRRRIGNYVSAHIKDVISRDYDALTGLMSWALFERKFIALSQREEFQRNDERTVALCFDIDRLHVINENLGPEKGDEMLAVFAGILREHVGVQIVTRITSDTFGLIMTDTDMDEAQDLAEKIRVAFSEIEFTNGSKKERASVSIGIGPVDTEVGSASAALALAQVACKAAKDRGRGRVESFQLDDKSIIQRMDDIQLVGDIRIAIESGRLKVLCQPIIPLNDNININYYETLVRLIGPSGEEIPPADFFSSAERYQLMEDLDRWVIRETLSKMAENRACLFDGPLRIAINLSGQSLGSKGFLPFVQNIIKEFDVPPETICFEITETAAIANLKRAEHFMHTLRKNGCHFSLDDFGTGLSSFAYLKLFPISTLKIDGSFVSDINSNVVSKSVCAAISEVARVMELDTVAECVPDDAAIELLRDSGVTYGQGFFMGELEPIEVMFEKLAISATSKNTVQELIS
jgi:diguanylate cyclase (GGDEF)-like protein